MLRDPFDRIWKGDLFRSFRDRESDPAWAGLPEKCHACPDLPLCGGGCRIERETRAGGSAAGCASCASSGGAARGHRSSGASAAAACTCGGGGTCESEVHRPDPPTGLVPLRILPSRREA